MSLFIISISIIVQFASAAVALWQIRLTGYKAAWAFIAVALALMGIRRSVTWYRVVSGDTELPADLTAELIALSISVLMLIGVVLIGRLFREAHENKKKAEKANQAKSEFLANMSHELRTPLNSIIGFAEMMNYEIKGPIPATYKEDTALIMGSGRLLLETVNSILDIAKIEAGTFDLQTEPVHMAAVVDEAMALLKVQSAEKGIAFYNETQDMHRLDVDPPRIKQVLLNVIGNAIKFTEQGSVIVMNHCDDEGHNISVIDTGIGMSAEEIEIALMPFQQVHGTSMARRYQGTGLGLSLSRRIMQQHGGDLRITSAPGTGTTVTLHFPVELGEANEP